MWELLSDALSDSVKILIFVFAVNFIFSFFEDKISQKNLGKNYASVPLAAALGLLPQCCFSVVAADKYSKRKISAGTIIAVFAATSDEAIPVFLSANDNRLAVLPMLAAKFAIAVLFGYLFDLLFPRVSASNAETPDGSTDSFAKNNNEKNESENEKTDDCGCGCMDHHSTKHAENKKRAAAFLEKHVFHPFVHSLKTFAAVIAINVVFALFLYFLTEDAIIAFLQTNKYFAPAVSAIVGLIPNCASSVLISKMYLSGGISFGACLSGLTSNAGLGLLYLFKTEKRTKNVLIITAYLIGASVLSGYICCLIFGF